MPAFWPRAGKAGHATAARCVGKIFSGEILRAHARFRRMVLGSRFPRSAVVVAASASRVYFRTAPFPMLVFGAAPLGIVLARQLRGQEIVKFVIVRVTPVRS